MQRLRTQAGSSQLGFRSPLTLALAHPTMSKNAQCRLLRCRFPAQVDCRASHLLNPLPCPGGMYVVKLCREADGLRPEAGSLAVRRRIDMAPHQRSRCKPSAAADAIPNKFV